MSSASKWALSLLFYCSAVAAQAGSRHPEYAIDAIPQALKLNANAVLRNETTTVDVVSPDEVVVQSTRVISILDAEGAVFARPVSFNSDLQSIDDLSVIVYDATGSEVEHAGKKAFRNLPLNFQSSNLTEVVLKTYNVAYSAFPFTVAYTERYTIHHTFLLPSWSPQAGNNARIAIEHADFRLISPKQLGVHYRSLGGMPNPSVSGDTVSLHLAGLGATKSEDMAASGDYNTPVLLLAADTISLLQYKGLARTWKQLGAFIYKLNAGRSTLTPEDLSYVNSIAATIKDKQRVINALYRYMQQRCRYVSIQLGIGGWQTLPASFVGTKQYGDCKALSNYMMSLLAVAGINAYVVIIDAGPDYRPIQRDFPVGLFNHEILCIPTGADTTWLECTSTDNAPGYLGSFTEDRDALMITPEGGILIHTPTLNGKQNFIERHIVSEVVEGIMEPLQLSAIHSGYLHDLLHPHITNHSNDDISNYVNHKFTLPSYTVDSFRYEPLAGDSPIPAIKEEARIIADGLVSTSSARLFVNMNLMPLELPSIAADSRTTTFQIRHSMAIVDTFSIRIPHGYVAESIPKKLKLQEPFGTYDLEIIMANNTIILYRRLTLNAGTYRPEQYPPFAAFIERIEEEANYRTVLRHN